MVEASLVLPILILTILSLIMLLIYFFSCLNMQSEVHTELLKEEMTSEKTFEVKKSQNNISSQLGGVVSILMSKEIHSKKYCLREARLIRLGEIINDT